MQLRRPHPRAFTLLELVLVLVVLAILGGFAVPRLSGSLRGQRLDAQVRTLIALARKARALAAAEGRSYLLLCDPQARTLRLARQRDPLAAPDDDADPEREALSEDAAWARPLAFEEGIELSAFYDASLADPTLLTQADDQPFEIRFRPDGSSEARVLVFQGGKRQLQVRVEAHLGRARLLDGDEVLP